MLKKSRKPYLIFPLVGALLSLALAGCGGGSSNVVTVAVSPSTSTVIVSQSLTLTAIVSGTTDTTINGWTCQYQTTAVDSSGNSKTGSLQACTSATGTIPANSTSTTVTYTAPNQVPNPTTISGNNCASGANSGNGTSCLLSIIITATAHANTKKTATCTISLDSGIAVTLNTTTATVPTKEEQLFSATLTNDLQTEGVTWLVTQGTPTTTLPYPSLTSCSPTCGTITATGTNTATYTAPTAVPTTATVTYVATSKADTTRFAVGTITIVTGGPITFNGLAPTIAPQGAAFYDIYLDAPFISSASVVSILAPGATKPQAVPITQLKVLFPIPNTTVTNPTSTGARIRLLASNLANSGTYTVSISDPAEPVSLGVGPFSYTVQPVRPTSVASVPNSIPQNGAGNELNLAVNGGYFGPGGNTLANVTFNGVAVPQNSTIVSSSRQLNLAFQSASVNSVAPGLYPLDVSRTQPPLPSLNNSSVTNIAISPDYSVRPPMLVLSTPPTPAGTNPSAADIDTKLGVLVVAETGSNLVQFFSIGNNSLTSLPCPASSCAVNAPTGLSVNQTNHTVAVVSAQDQKVVVLPFPCPPALQTGSTCTVSIGDTNPNISYPLSVSLVGLIPSAVSPQPLPYSVGIDSDTNHAVVAYSSNASPTTAKVGYLIDFNSNSQQTCLQPNGSVTGSPCVHAQVTLNTGAYPQVAMVPHTHTALVTPGGAGTVSGIDVTRGSSSLQIANVSLISGLVTVTVNIPSGQTLGLNPGNPGTVLIQGVPNGAGGTNFNGVFSVLSVLNTNSFTYPLTSTINDSSTCTSSNNCEVFFSAPNLTIAASQTLQGIAINPISRTAAMADANATGNNGPQIDLLNSLDQSISSITFNAECTSASISLPCTGAPELLGTTDVAFQPYTNVLVSYNPQQNQVSISDPTNLKRNAFVCNLSAVPPSPIPPASTCITNPVDSTSQAQFLAQSKLPGPGASSVTVNGTTLTLFGGLAIDPVTNQAFVVQSGAGNILIVDLTNTSVTPGTQPVQITELQVPSVSGAVLGGIAGAQMPQGTLTSASNLTGVQIFGSGFDSNAQVLLDGTLTAGLGSSNPATVDPNGRRITFTVPASALSLPHRYAVTVSDGGVTSNATDFIVIKAVDFSKNATICRDSSGNGLDAQPNSVAIADQLPGQSFSPIAVVTNSGCNNVAIIDINPASATFGTFTGPKLIPTGNSPVGVAVSPRFGLAVVANSTDGTASVLDLLAGTQKVAAVTVGSSPAGVAIDEGTGAALIANSGTNTVSELNLALLFATGGNTTIATSLTATTIAVDQSPIAVAINPDDGTNFQGLAVVSALQLVAGGTAVGVLDSVDIGGATPAKSITASVGNVTATPTGVVFDPCPMPAVASVPETCAAPLFYATSSGGNVITAFNPDGGATSSVHVGINPTSLAINPQTGGVITINSAGQTISIVDTLSNSFKTRSSFGLSGSAQFGVAIDQFTNMAVIADQANNRLLIFPIPN